MKTIREKIAIMQAFLNGEKIQSLYETKWIDITGYPLWDWVHSDYRIKPKEPERKILPYESEEEFISAQKEHGPYMRLKNDKDYFYMPLSVCNDGIDIIDGEFYGYDRLPKLFIWQDKTPVGKEVEE